MSIKLYNADCFDILTTIPDNSVDLVLCDPPYELSNWTNPYDWDRTLDFEKLWEQLDRVLRHDRCSVLLFGNEPYSTIQRNSNLSNFKYDYIWVKNKVTGFMNAKVKPLKSYEIISVFSKGTTSPGRNNNMIYNPQGLVKVDKTIKNNGSAKSRTVQAVRKSMESNEYTQEYTNYPKDVLMYDCETGLHPTQKPVTLLSHLIQTYSDTGNTVLDFTMGSGSTGVAAIEVERDFIGIEKNDEYFNIAKNRIEESTHKAGLFDF